MIPMIRGWVDDIELLFYVKICITDVVFIIKILQDNEIIIR